MKFLCDNCKAKYQIADEKVAGKTVRMKCRKCGHQIEVRAAVTETSVSTAPPKAPSDAPAPRPGAAPTRQNLATSLAGQKPRAPVAPQAHMTQPMGGASAATGGGALAGAFQRNVTDAPQSGPAPSTSPAERELSVTDEWYVAINGVPVGPVRISELRRKAAGGAVTEDSLCWQEGLEEWRPVRTVPDLAALVREAAQGNRPSLTAPAPSDRQSSPPRPPQRPAAPPARTAEPARASEPPAPRAPMTAPMPQRSNVVPLRPAAQSSSDDMFGSLGGGSGSGAAAALAPAFTPQPVASPFAPTQPLEKPLAPPAPVPIPDPFALPPPAAPGIPATTPSAAIGSGANATASGAVAPVYPSMAPTAPRRQGVPLWFWLVALFTVSFGGVAAYAMFFRPVQPPAPVVIQMPATNTAPTQTGDIPPPPPSTTETAPTASASATGTKVATGPAKAGTGGTAPAATEKKTTDISGLLGDGKGGPGVGGSGPGAAGGGGGLDQSSVERVVASHRAGVKRTCWERGGADQKSSVNVTVSATVAPDGSVSGTSSSGDDPVVAKCIETQVRSWRFNAPGSTTTINIPFKFVRQ